MVSRSNVRIEGLDELLESFRRAGGIIDRQGRSWLRDQANYGVKQAQIHTLNEGAVFTNEFIQGLHYELHNSGRGLEAVIRPSDKADKYAMPLEEGSKPHKAPIEALRPWADAHGIPVGAVWWKIATEGTEPRWIFRSTFSDLDKEVDKEVPRLADNILRAL